jgi:hypothetical protein
MLARGAEGHEFDRRTSEALMIDPLRAREAARPSVGRDPRQHRESEQRGARALKQSRICGRCAPQPGDLHEQFASCRPRWGQDCDGHRFGQRRRDPRRTRVARSQRTERQSKDGFGGHILQVVIRSVRSPTMKRPAARSLTHMPRR